MDQLATADMYRRVFAFLANSIYSPNGDFEHHITGYVNDIFTAYKFI